MSLGSILRAFGLPRVSVQTSSFTLANASYSGLSVGVADDGSRPSGVYVSPDGTKMYIVGDSRDGVTEYDLTTPHDVSTASRVQFVSTGNNETGITFVDDGTKMYITSSFDDRIKEFTLSTPWDISTATQDNSIDIADYTSGRDCHVKADGTLIIIADSGGIIYEMLLSTPYDLSTESQGNSLDITGQATDTFGVFVSPDGTKMLVADSGGGRILEYDLSTAWDITTASFTRSFDTSTQAPEPEGIGFSNNGQDMYVVEAHSTVYQYDTPA